MRPAYALLTILLLLTSQARADERASVCELTKDPARYDARRVVVFGQVIHGGVDHFGLFDASCRVNLRWTSKAEKDPGADRLRTALFREGEFGTLGKVVMATFTGVFERGDGDEPFSEGHKLHFEKVENLSVERAK